MKYFLILAILFLPFPAFAERVEGGDKVRIDITATVVSSADITDGVVSGTEADCKEYLYIYERRNIK